EDGGKQARGGEKEGGHGVTQGPVHEDAARPWCRERPFRFTFLAVPRIKITTIAFGQPALREGAGGPRNRRYSRPPPGARSSRCGWGSRERGRPGAALRCRTAA